MLTAVALAGRVVGGAGDGELTKVVVKAGKKAAGYIVRSFKDWKDAVLKEKSVKQLETALIFAEHCGVAFPNTTPNDEFCPHILALKFEAEPRKGFEVELRETDLTGLKGLFLAASLRIPKKFPPDFLPMVRSYCERRLKKASKAADPNPPVNDVKCRLVLTLLECAVNMKAGDIAVGDLLKLECLRQFVMELSLSNCFVPTKVPAEGKIMFRTVLHSFKNALDVMISDYGERIIWSAPKQCVEDMENDVGKLHQLLQQVALLASTDANWKNVIG
jgi:hypothetical protein